jgi:hypothetical protein
VILRGCVAKSIAAVAAASLVTLGSPAPATARVIVSVEFVYGSVAAGGVGIFVALSGSWEAFARDGGIPDALIEVRGTRVRLGMPLVPLQAAADDDAGDRPVADGLLLNLVRWRF